MSSYTKGNASQKLADDYLKAQGYRTSPARRVRWSDNDHFNVFDNIATKRGEKVRWIQVTSRENVSHKIKKIKDVDVPLDPEHSELEVWGYVKGQGRHFRVYRSKNDWKFVEGDVIKV